MSSRAAALLTAVAALVLVISATAVGAGRPRSHTSRVHVLESAITATLNTERVAAGVRRLRYSRILQDIAEHRARVSRARGDAYPGYDVSGDLAYYRVCIHGAREWEFAFNATSPGSARHAVRVFASQFPSYRQDLLAPGWRQIAVGAAVAGGTTYLIEDFASLCR